MAVLESHIAASSDRPLEQAPIFTVVIFAFLDVLEGKNWEGIKAQIKRDFWCVGEWCRMGQVGSGDREDASAYLPISTSHHTPGMSSPPTGRFGSPPRSSIMPLFPRTCGWDGSTWCFSRYVAEDCMHALGWGRLYMVRAMSHPSIHAHTYLHTVVRLPVHRHQPEGPARVERGVNPLSLCMPSDCFVSLALLVFVGVLGVNRGVWG